MTDSHEGKMTGWSVEARYNYPDPLCVNENVTITKEWKRICFARTKIGGIPMGAWPEEPLSMLNLHSYEQAEALRWSLMAEASAKHKICLETRLAAHKVEYSVKGERADAYEHKEIGDSVHTLEKHEEAPR